MGDPVFSARGSFLFGHNCLYANTVMPKIGALCYIFREISGLDRSYEVKKIDSDYFDE